MKIRKKMRVLPFKYAGNHALGEVDKYGRKGAVDKYRTIRLWCTQAFNAVPIGHVATTVFDHMNPIEIDRQKVQMRLVIILPGCGVLDTNGITAVCPPLQCLASGSVRRDEPGIVQSLTQKKVVVAQVNGGVATAPVRCQQYSVQVQFLHEKSVVRKEEEVAIAVGHLFIPLQ